MQTAFDKLYADSVSGRQFRNLVELIQRPENIMLAYRNLRKNSGSKTAGVDKKTISDLNKWSDKKLVNHVQRKLDWYVPNAVRRVEIPKDNGKKRPLGIPTIMDRLIQQCILQVLEPICEAKFFKRSNGFRPTHSAENAIAQAERMIQNIGCYYVIDIDIHGFFDNVNHGKLLKQMWALGIRDKKLLSIISAMLKAEVAGIGFPEKGTPQGGIISPLLSNIVLNELDAEKEKSRISKLSESTREDAGADEGTEKRRNVFCRQQERTGTATDPIKRKSPRIRSQSVLGKNPRWLF